MHYGLYRKSGWARHRHETVFIVGLQVLPLSIYEEPFFHKQNNQTCAPEWILYKTNVGIVTVFVNFMLRWTKSYYPHLFLDKDGA